MTEEKSIFDPNVSIELELPKIEPKVEPKIEPKIEPKVDEVVKKVDEVVKKVDEVVKKVEQEVPNIEPITEVSSDTSIVDHVIDYIKEIFYPFDQNIGNILLAIFTLATIGYIIYELIEKEGFVNKVSGIMDKQYINFNDIDMYYINLDRATKRKAEFERQSKQQDLDVKRYSAIEGRTIPDEIIEQVLGHPKSEDFKHSILVDDRKQIGHFGCFLSHIGIYQGFMESDKPYCLIFEDDAEFKTETFKRDVNRHMGNMPPDWDIVLFGFHTADDLHHDKNKNTFLKNDIFHNMEHWTGTHAYLINKKSCQQLLEKLVNPEWYLDWAISGLVQEGKIKAYAVFEPLVCQPACYTIKFDNKHMKMHHIQNCKYGGGMTTTFSE